MVIDATGNPNIGTRFALDAIANGKHVVMLNVEADITIGRHLHEEARRAGVIYTGAAGDEPAATLELIGFAQSIGLDIICAGKGKNNPLKFDAVPAEYEAEAKARNMNARMLVEFVDGSKTMIEMVAIANCTGLVPDVPGMHGPAATRDELASVLVPKADGGVLSKAGCVDYSIGKAWRRRLLHRGHRPSAGARAPDRSESRQGSLFHLFRPYHLTSLEVPLSAARAVLHKRADMVPLEQPIAEAITVAKRDLKPGEDAGQDRRDRVPRMGHDPCGGAQRQCRAAGPAEGAKVIKPVKAGEYLTYENCVPDDSFIVTQIRKRLDQSDARLHRL